MAAKSVYLQGQALILLCLILGSSASVRAQSSSVQQQVQTCPTGSLLAFPKRFDANKAVDRVYIRRSSSYDRRIWEMPAVPVTFEATGDASKNEQGIGFIVPQLNRGRYEAWYGAADLEQATDSLTFDAVAQLLVENAIVRGKPLSRVDVYVRIFSPKLIRKGRTVPERISALVTLKPNDLSLVQVISPPSVRTDANGYARWRVLIKKAGIAELTASAYQFEPAVLNVVGMPANAPSFWQAQLVALNERAAELEARANRQDEPAAMVANRVGGVATVSESATASTGREQGVRHEQVMAIPPPGGGGLAERARAEAIAARAAEQAWITAMANEPRRINASELQPGDVLLVLGSSSISEKILNFERRNLGGVVSYSHASLYLGEFNGVRLVGEMWSSGFWITPLPVSVAGNRFVDVYRFRQLKDPKRQALANLTADIVSRAARLIRSDAPSFFARGSFLPYAFEEITLLGLAGTGGPGRILTLTIQNLVDPYAGGRRKMICSELVAWTYHDAGLELEVPYWKVLSDLNIFTSHERQHDYTTPNMLAHSRSLGIVGRYAGP